MRWKNPAVQLDHEAVYALLAIRGLDDWLQPADFFDLNRYLRPTTEDEYRSSAIDLAGLMLRRGHASAGDVTTEGHRPWAGSSESHIERITALWLDPEVDARFAFVWFDLTDSGRAFAEEAARHTAEPE